MLERVLNRYRLDIAPLNATESNQWRFRAWDKYAKKETVLQPRVTQVSHTHQLADDIRPLQQTTELKGRPFGTDS